MEPEEPDVSHGDDLPSLCSLSSHLCFEIEEESVDCSEKVKSVGI